MSTLDKVLNRAGHTADCFPLLPTEQWTKEHGNRGYDCKCDWKDAAKELRHLRADRTRLEELALMYQEKFYAEQDKNAALQADIERHVAIVTELASENAKLNMQTIPELQADALRFRDMVCKDRTDIYVDYTRDRLNQIRFKPLSDRIDAAMKP